MQRKKKKEQKKEEDEEEGGGGSPKLYIQTPDRPLLAAVMLFYIYHTNPVDQKIF